MTAAFVDAHCHLDRCNDPLGVARRARQQGVVVVSVTETPADFLRASRTFAGHTNVRMALGLHPLRVIDLPRGTLRSFADLLPTVRYVGEVGLDFSPEGHRSRDAQIRLLEDLLQMADAQSKVWSLHSRRAEAEVIAHVESARVHGALHWYTGPSRLIERALAAGLYFSVNPAMCQSASGERVIRTIPKDRVLTETDAPYGRRGSMPSSPVHVRTVVNYLAHEWGWTSNEVRDQVFGNMSALYSQATGTMRN